MSGSGQETRPSRAQLVYARILRVVSTLALVLVVAGYVVYVGGLVPGRVTPRDLAASWHLSAAELGKRLGDHGGWGWLRHIGAGDVISFASLAFLALGSIVCLLGTIPVLLAERSRVQALVAAGLVAILLLAASGLIVAQ